jgi:putative transcriptional regulator
MTIQHHPDPASLMAYAAGTLGEALGAVVAGHLERCGACRGEMTQLSAIGGALVGEVLAADNAPGAALADGALDRTLARLNGQATAPSRPVGSVVERLLGGPLSEAKWQRVAPGVKKIRLPVSKSASGALTLLHIGAGRAMPDHGHGGAEMTLVLEGAYVDKFGRFGPGDVADLDSDVDHEPTVEGTADCICLVASEHRARFKSGFMRLLQPWFGV